MHLSPRTRRRGFSEILRKRRCLTSRFAKYSGRALVVAVAAFTFRHVVLAGDGPAKAAPVWPVLEEFFKLSPAQRLRLIDQAGVGAPTTQKVASGILTLDIVERGTLAAAKNSDIVCTLKARTKQGQRRNFDHQVDC